MAMEEELQALKQQNTFQLVPRTPHMRVLGTKWVWKTKLNFDGSLGHLKAHYLAKRFNQVASLYSMKHFHLWSNIILFV